MMQNINWKKCQLKTFNYQNEVKVKIFLEMDQNWIHIQPKQN